MSCFATILFLDTNLLFSSLLLHLFIPSPIAFSIFLILLPSSLTHQALVRLYDRPSIFLSSVKCFSMTFAPNATAAIGISMPIVWSE